MKTFTGVALFAVMQGLLLLPQSIHAASIQSGAQTDNLSPKPAEWSSRGVQHVYGLPDAKPKDTGTLVLFADRLGFTGKASNSVIARQSVVAVSAGNQRVELWGVKGQLLRAVIPDGGGVAAAMVMHHRVDMLTVEFVDGKGGYHAAVFFLPANEATRALNVFAKSPIAAREPQSNSCANGFVWPNSLLLAAPNWEHADVPAAYRALVYERLYDRLRQVKGVDRVYRDGEKNADHGCPQYTMQLSITGFTPGNQVKRASLGPVGFFVGTTQMKFDATVTDPAGRVSMREQVAATIRGESESTNVATSVAKKLAKQYAAVVKKSGETRTATPPAAYGL